MNTFFRETKERLVITATENLDFPPHIHEEPELVYILKGTCTAYCAQQRYDLQAGDFFLACPEQVHHYQESKNCLACLIIVHPKHLALTHRVPVSAVYACRDEDLRLLLELTMREKDPAAALPMLRGVFAKLLRHYQFRDDPKQDSAALQVVRYCSSHYKEPLSVAAVAKALYLSQSHISHTFSEKLKISFSDYVNSLRLDEAVRLLQQTNRSIEQIAEAAGFPTVRTFNRVFRNKYGCCPREYKKSSL